MALYKYARYIATSNHNVFDQVYSPGANTPFSGIYRCEGCGDEVASNQGNPLPPQNHHQHSPSQARIQWRLVVFAQTQA